MHKLSVILPSRNEAINLERLVARIHTSLVDVKFEIVIVDDASSDNTQEVINMLKDKYQETEIQHLKHETQRGVYTSWEHGIRLSSGDCILLMDADLQNPPESILAMHSLLNKSGADLVLAIRRAIDDDINKTIRWARIKNQLVRILFRLKCNDATSGFVLGTSASVKKLLGTKPRLFNKQSHLMLFAHLENMKVREIETLFDKREGVNLTEVNSLSNFVGVLKFTFDLMLLRLFSFRKRSFQLAGVISNYKSPLRPVPRFFLWLYFKTSILHKWIIRSSVQDKYEWLKTVEFFDKASINRIQLVRLQELIRHAYFNVPYYQDLMTTSELSYNFLQKLDDLERFPLLSKTDVRKNIHFQMFAENHDKKYMHRIKTSGSTGEPFICYADKFQLEMRMATTLRAFEMTGWSYGEKQLRLWHQTLGMSTSQILKEKLDAVFMRRKFIPAFEMSKSSLKKLQELIRDYRPKLIDGYAESLNFLASMPFDYGSYTPKGLMSSAQQLTSETRAKIEEGFKSRVYDKYGSREFSGIAYQCSESSYHHVQDESYIVEILVEGRPAKPGEIGEIVITDLNNYSVPLIRYRIGDMAYAVDQIKCECGRSQTLIGNIVGRTQALIACSNGVWLPGTFFAHFFKDFDWCIKHYQVFQAELGELTLRIVPNGTFLEETRMSIIEMLSKFTGKDTKILIDIVDSIPLLSTGKRTPVISNVRMDFQALNSSSIQKS